MEEVILVERVAWMEIFGWGIISNVATCKSEGNGDEPIKMDGR